MIIPYIDPRVKHISITKLRTILNGEKLDSLTDLLVIERNNDPVAVLLSYKNFMALQKTTE